jgi:hypothetical protein
MTEAQRHKTLRKRPPGDVALFACIAATAAAIAASRGGCCCRRLRHCCHAHAWQQRRLNDLFTIKLVILICEVWGTLGVHHTEGPQAGETGQSCKQQANNTQQDIFCNTYIAMHEIGLARCEESSDWIH